MLLLISVHIVPINFESGAIILLLDFDERNNKILDEDCGFIAAKLAYVDVKTQWIRLSGNFPNPKNAPV